MEDKQITEVREKLMSVLELVEKFEPSRAQSISKTKIQEATMWLGTLYSKEKTDGIIKHK